MHTTSTTKKLLPLTDRQTAVMTAILAADKQNSRVPPKTVLDGHDRRVWGPMFKIGYLSWDGDTIFRVLNTGKEKAAAAPSKAKAKPVRRKSPRSQEGPRPPKAKPEAVSAAATE